MGGACGILCQPHPSVDMADASIQMYKRSLQAFSIGQVGTILCMLTIFGGFSCIIAVMAMCFTMLASCNVRLETVKLAFVFSGGHAMGMAIDLLNETLREKIFEDPASTTIFFTALAYNAF